MAQHTHYITDIQLDDGIVISRAPQVEEECQRAVKDLLEENHFRLCQDDKGNSLPENAGPYSLHLSVVEARLVMDIASLGHKEKDHTHKLTLSVRPFRQIIKDYFIICESYYSALKQTTRVQTETIDMARRGIHNEGSDLLKSLLEPRIDVDFATARRLFTLICVLHVR